MQYKKFNIACGLKGCPPIPDIPNGNVAYLPDGTLNEGCYLRDTFVLNTCDTGYRLTGPSSRACSGNFEDKVLESVNWAPDDDVMCVRKFMVPAWDN